MTGTQYVLMILGGGSGTVLLVAAIARALVHRHGDPAAAEKYLTWFRAERAAEQAALVRAEMARTTAERPKELTR